MPTAPLRLLAWLAVLLLGAGGHPAAPAAVDPEPTAAAVATVVGVLPGAATVLAQHADGQVTTGSGFFISREGRFVTNAHVLSGAVRVSIQVEDGTVHPAQRVAVDPALDVAELWIPGRWAPLVLSADPAWPGNVVFALGDPGGRSPDSASWGRVTGAHLALRSREGHFYPDVLRSDAVVAPGSSGGPLTDERARVVGIVSLVVDSSGFAEAIPTDRFAPALAGWARVAPRAW